MLIKNTVICDIDGEKVVDVLIEKGIIVTIGTNLQAKHALDAKGAYLLPALIDTNVRLLDSNLHSKNIEKVAAQAKLGGVYHIVLNADSQPAIDNEVVLEFAQHGISSVQDMKIDLMLNSLQENSSLSNIAILLKKGAIAPYMSTIAKNDVAIKIAEYVKMYDVTLYCKAEDNSLMSAGVMLDGNVNSKLGLAGIPQLSEVLHVSRMIEIARYFDIKILFKAIASPRSVELIAKAKAEGIRVSCEVSIHHLVLCDESCNDFNTLAKLNPPLSSREDMLLLQEALSRGDIDILTTLHQPSSPVNKEVAFYDAAYGCEAIADALPLYYTKLVKSGLISMTELIKLTSLNPAKSMNIQANSMKVGEMVNCVLFNPTQTYTVHNKESLYYDEILQGTILEVPYEVY